RLSRRSSDRRTSSCRKQRRLAIRCRKFLVHRPTEPALAVASARASATVLAQAKALESARAGVEGLAGEFIAWAAGSALHESFTILTLSTRKRLARRSIRERLC